MKESKAVNILLLISKILIIVILALSTLYYAILLTDAYIESVNTVPPESGIYIEPFPIALAFTLIFSLITNGICVFLSLLGLILSFVYRESPKRKNNIRIFAILILIPIFLELVLLLLGLFLN